MVTVSEAQSVHGATGAAGLIQAFWPRRLRTAHAQQARSDVDLERQAVAALAPVFANLMSRLDEGAPTVLHVTSATAGEGTSTVARGLAAAAAATGWCSTSLIEIATGTEVDTAGIACLPFHHSRRTAESLGDPVAYRRLLEQSRATARLTILDCPPVLACMAVAARAHLADGVLLVVGAEQATLPALREARDMLLRFNASLIGAVFNKRRGRLPRVLARWL